jgi:hypothetical protein
MKADLAGGRILLEIGGDTADVKAHVCLLEKS